MGTLYFSFLWEIKYKNKSCSIRYTKNSKKFFINSHNDNSNKKKKKGGGGGGGGGR